jgi:hypothetical protein
LAEVLLFESNKTSFDLTEVCRLARSASGTTDFASKLYTAFKKTEKMKEPRVFESSGW